MPVAQEIDQVLPGLFTWQFFDKAVKADLFSTGLETPGGTYLIDPIPLTPEALSGLRERRKVAGIFVTNVNHPRAATQFAETFAVPIFSYADLTTSFDFPTAAGVRDGEMFSEGLTAIALEGGPAGEMALHFDQDGGTMILGDALINFEPHGFGFLPVKYCLDAKLMRGSLRKLLDYSLERMFFAHGTPILSGARARLQQLLGAG